MISPLQTPAGYGAYIAKNNPASAASAWAAAAGGFAAVIGRSAAPAGEAGFNAVSGVSTPEASASGVSASGGTSETRPTDCESCKNRKYQDISTDAGVSFKAPANIDPAIAATSVMAHEKEHVALAEGRAAESGGQVISSVTLETSICEECGRVYVSGGKAHITTITPVEKQDTGTAKRGKMAHDDGGADLFRKIYKQTMTGNFGLFFDAKA